ncbi:4565_t:CDS:2, partial [Dentiscutata erythropus]
PTNKATNSNAYTPPPTVSCLPRTNQLEVLLTIIRNKETHREDFIFYSDRIIRLLVEEGLNHLPVVEKKITTPTGEAMEQGLRDCCRSVRIGKILIQRDEETALPKLYYAKLPPDVENRYVLLLDPMLATGGSAIKAVEVLLSYGVKEEKILFLNLVAAPEGIQAITSKYSKLKILTAYIDEGLNEKKYIIPGLGDF